MTGLRGEAAIIGIAELPAEKRQSAPPSFTLDQYARLAKMVIEDAGVDPAVVNGLSTHGIAESNMFAPATLSEYLGLPLDFGDRVDLGGATAAGMVWRAAAAVELGLCDAVLAVMPGSTEMPRSESKPGRTLSWYGASSNNYGSPQAEFEIPYGNVGQNGPYAQIAQRYAHEFGYDAAALARIAVHQRTNACAHPGAVFHGKPITVDDVLNSPVIADPIHMLETVMRVQGGAGVLIANADVAREAAIARCGSRVSASTSDSRHPTYADDLMRTPIARCRGTGLRDGGAAAVRRRRGVDLRLLHDHRADDARGRGLLRQGRGHEVADGARPDLPRRLPAQHRRRTVVLRAGRMAGGMHHVVDGARQVMGRSGEAQVADCNTAFVTGNGGIMSEQVALILGWRLT